MERREFMKNTLLAGGSLLTGSAFANVDLKSARNGDTQKVLDYIQSNWERTFYKDAPGSGFKGFDLPYQYSTPSIKGEGKFSFFFYWDNYFTHLGLFRNGYTYQVKNNIKNMLWLIEEQGYMPNHVALHNRSQSPYFQLMVEEYLATEKDVSEDFAKKCAEGVRKEYQFWMTARYSTTGLNHFGHHEDRKGCINFYNGFLVWRLNLPKDVSDDQKAIVGGHGIAEAENWDFTQRYSGRAMDFNAVDLNALLWGYENFLYDAAKKYGWYLKDFYKDRADKRLNLINQHLWDDEKGWFFDYDFVNNKHSEIYSLSGMQPMFMKMATKEQAEKMKENLQYFEKDYGVATTKEHPGCRNYQWAYPVVWPPMVYVVVKSLDNYGYKEDAKRIANKYVEVNTALFKEYGKLFEKTDAETGTKDETEYGAEFLMDWTAGVYVTLVDYLKSE
jgi:alpha,alpha-trehalase